MTKVQRHTSCCTRIQSFIPLKCSCVKKEIALNSYEEQQLGLCSGTSEFVRWYLVNISTILAEILNGFPQSF